MSDYIYGKNSVVESLKIGQGEKLYIQRQDPNRRSSFGHVISLAKDLGLPIIELDRAKLDKMSEGGNHQGILLLSSGFSYSSLDDLFALAEARGEDPFFLLLDGITDPQNFGAIIRSAECVGVHGIIIPERRSVSVTSTVHKTSAGATSYMKVCQVTNLNQTIDQLKKRNVWVYGADMKGDKSLWETDFSGSCCIVIGSEGEGMHRLTREKCDFLVSIPMLGKINSLNASCSASILMYEVLRTRRI